MELCLKETLEKWRVRVQNAGISPNPPEPIAKQTRRTNKPLTEKRRRARINRSLADLKNILLNDRRIELSLNGRNNRQAKLEKADILEMTVRHFKMLQDCENKGSDVYRAGFIACIKEVERFMSFPDLTVSTFAEFIDRDFKLKLLKHLESCECEFANVKEKIRKNLIKKLVPNSLQPNASLKNNLRDEKMIIGRPTVINPIVKPSNDEPLDFTMPKARSFLEKAPTFSEVARPMQFVQPKNDSKMYTENLRKKPEVSPQIPTMPDNPTEKVILFIPGKCLSANNARRATNATIKPETMNSMPIKAKKYPHLEFHNNVYQRKCNQMTFGGNQMMSGFDKFTMHANNNNFGQYDSNNANFGNTRMNNLQPIYRTPNIANDSMWRPW